MPTDSELIKEILDGSQSAMEVLIRRHYKTVFAFIYRHLGDYHTSYDLTQEVFIKVMKSLKYYRESNQFEHWIIKIAVNCCRNYYSSREYADKNSLVPYDEITGDTNITNLFDQSSNQQEIKKAILSLSKDQRDAVILFYYSGYKIREISKMTGSNDATVKSRLHQALKKLKKIFVGGGYFAER
ncbi:RNA polymerase sigma factor [Ethanoligenens harbinense]|uniref:RNA polymerase, sigma-24 subunit, ECF subfamily n=1 Tax=Ethanoligenens harbinense (strain DSM 18485 / JCM 12961 / CGMCC 1.5033 / YUAN-3) TaxID=663278 RepID=E6U943_ETHHY|nr:sigma-70 family RNA polymerase sigma factor [Ethanoligenens harbinense]ADU26107.1 RNA polymerase, sigma-24 subunit, ECF subfamily [Ethanoligenens harbinense YUAN-3]AVQ95252.1 sigma-70 family RNA polymerase sigma factor [Ethanoligenens harbinense YUAN-3]AYF40663.1 sigma-70 family RNA polymerase sigma factor [Ethanoligenens harbinense]QCN91497.1 sigma-70 family RNA polymerase sigma factor [Ethanoligenens harbinense]